MANRLVAKLDLLCRFAKAEAFKQRAPSARQRPLHRVLLVSFERRIQLALRKLKSAFRRDDDLAFEKIRVAHAFVSPASALRASRTQSRTRSISFHI